MFGKQWDGDGALLLPPMTEEWDRHDLWWANSLCGWVNLPTTCSALFGFGAAGHLSTYKPPFTSIPSRTAYSTPTWQHAP